MTFHSLIVDRDVATPCVMARSCAPISTGLRPMRPLPVLLQRTPYGKGFSQTSFALMAAERGYAVVLQDTRGRWASDGDGYPLVHEQQDGYDTVVWCAGQPVVRRARGHVWGILRGLHPVCRRLPASARPDHDHSYRHLHAAL